jgi:hypothetical protein
MSSPGHPIQVYTLGGRGGGEGGGGDGGVAKVEEMVVVEKEEEVGVVDLEAVAYSLGGCMRIRDASAFEADFQ